MVWQAAKRLRSLVRTRACLDIGAGPPCKTLQAPRSKPLDQQWLQA